ncbi:hypothetical protein ACFSTC_59015 [Nonomuraea ferruginea]
MAGLLAAILLIAVDGDPPAAHPHVRHRRLHRFHHEPGRHGQALAPAAPAPLAPRHAAQRDRGGAHLRGGPRAAGVEVHRGRLGGRHRHPLAHPPVRPDRALLRRGGGRAGDRRRAQPGPRGRPPPTVPARRSSSPSAGSTPRRSGA